MTWIQCITETDLMKWHICGDAFLHNECIITVEQDLELIERKDDARYYAYLDSGVPKIIFCIIYKSYCDSFKLHIGAIADKEYMLIYHTKLKDIMIETEKNFYMPTLYLTLETTQLEFRNGWADNSIPDILSTLGVNVTIREKVITFKVE